MENPAILDGSSPVFMAPAMSLAPSEEFNHSDLDRAREIVSEIVANDPMIRDIAAFADEAVTAALQCANRGERSEAVQRLMAGLVASSLAAWQWCQLANEAVRSRNFTLGQSRRAVAERLLNRLPGQASVSAAVARGIGSPESEIVTMRAVLLAFVAGSGVARTVLGHEAAILLTAAIEAGFDSSAHVAIGGGLRAGVPPLTTGGTRGRRSHRSKAKGRPALSSREQDVLSLIVTGQTTAEIAYHLGVKTTTVATLVGRMFNKLGVNNRPAAVGVALRYGLCALPDESAA